MSSGRDKVQEYMNTIVTEAGIALDTRFFSQNIIVLTLEVANDLLEAGKWMW